jgi:hypothetical protein
MNDSLDRETVPGGTASRTSFRVIENARLNPVIAPKGEVGTGLMVCLECVLMEVYSPLILVDAGS